MKKTIILAAALATIVGAFLATGASDFTPRERTIIFMRLKMVHSQGILEGLALEKYDQIASNALLLRNMSQSNLWYVSKSVPFRDHSTEFQHRVDALYLAAKDKKLKESTEAYKQVVESCVACHADFRLEQRTEHLKPKSEKQ